MTPTRTQEETSLTTCRPDYVVDNTFELFCDLEASDEQCDFPVVYASGVQGIAGDDPKNMADTLAPLFDTIVREIKPPLVKIDAPLQLLVGTLLRAGTVCIRLDVEGSKAAFSAPPKLPLGQAAPSLQA